MYLFADTETSDPKHQRVCQLAAILCDEKGEELEVFNTLIKPDGWEIHPRFVEIHGITTEDCIRRGIPIQLALTQFHKLVELSKMTICHNFKFDSARILNEYNICGCTTQGQVFSSRPYFCTMVHMTDICQIPHPSGRPGYKWPKLVEAHEFLFKVGFEKAHDALADTRACKRIFFEVQRQKRSETPAFPKVENAPSINISSESLDTPVL